MKRIVTILSLTIFISSCNSFTESGVINNENELKEIAEIGFKNKIEKFTWGDKDIDGLNWKLQKRQIDFFEIKIKGDKGTETVTDLDSVVVFTKLRSNMFDDTDIIVYDFAKTPRQRGSFVVTMADYEQIMVADRWYLITVGFD